MTTLVLDAALNSSHKLARRILSKMRAHWDVKEFVVSTVSLAPQEERSIGTTDFLLVQFDSTLGEYCGVSWTNGPTDMPVRQLLVLDAPLTGVVIKNLLPSGTTKVVAKVITAVK